MASKHVAVLMGGWSSEREVSLSSGKSCAEGLRNAGRDLTTESFLKGTEQIQGFKDVFGGADLNFSATKHNGRDDISLAVIKDGRWVNVVDDMR